MVGPGGEVSVAGAEPMNLINRKREGYRMAQYLTDARLAPTARVYSGVALVLASLTLIGCASRVDRDLPQRWVAVSEDQLSASQQKQYRQAVQARDALFQRLMQRLQSILHQDGPAKAVIVCKEQAPAIAQAVTEEYGVRIGRTSYKIRNPANHPPDWASEVVATRTPGPAFFAHPDGRLGVLLPIRLKEQCLICHGSRDQIVEAVRTELAANYPNDQAVGFAVDDLRGWFWVEVNHRD
jgi:hypothetical protein